MSALSNEATILLLCRLTENTRARASSEAWEGIERSSDPILPRKWNPSAAATPGGNPVSEPLPKRRTTYFSMPSDYQRR